MRNSSIFYVYGLHASNYIKELEAMYLMLCLYCRTVKAVTILLVFSSRHLLFSMQLVKVWPCLAHLVYLTTWKQTQEIVSIYPALSPPVLSAGASNRVCNALALLQVQLQIKSGVITFTKLLEGTHVITFIIAYLYCLILCVCITIIAVCCIAPWYQNPFLTW